jgi:hypothetical protein
MAGQTGEERRAEAPAAPPDDELLCTICGLTACWTAPGKAPAQAVAEQDDAEAAPSP